MIQEEFESLMQEIFQEVKEILLTKGKEYGNKEDDFLEHFRRGHKFGVSPLQYCAILANKGEEALLTAIQTGKEGKEGFRSRIIDAIAYKLFLLANWEEEKKAKS